MTTFDKVAPGAQVRIASVDGSVRLVTRLASVGLVPGAVLRIERADRNRPVLVFERDTRLAVNRADCARISVEEVA